MRHLGSWKEGERVLYSAGLTNGASAVATYSAEHAPLIPSVHQLVAALREQCGLFSREILAPWHRHCLESRQADARICSKSQYLG